MSPLPNAYRGEILVIEHGGDVMAAMLAYPNAPEFDDIQAYRSRLARVGEFFDRLGAARSGGDRRPRPQRPDSRGGLRWLPRLHQDPG